MLNLELFDAHVIQNITIIANFATIQLGTLLKLGINHLKWARFWPPRKLVQTKLHFITSHCNSTILNFTMRNIRWWIEWTINKNALKNHKKLTSFYQPITHTFTHAQTGLKTFTHNRLTISGVLQFMAFSFKQNGNKNDNILKAIKLRKIAKP